MPLMDAKERHSAEAAAGLVSANPFLPERMDLERRALGAAFGERDAVWSIRPEPYEEHPNILRLRDRVERLCLDLRERLARGAEARSDELGLYQDLALYVLYYRYIEPLRDVIVDQLRHPSKSPRVTAYDSFERDFRFYIHLPGVNLPTAEEPDHLFASFFQVRRAFYHIFNYIVGGSLVAARLRAAVWQSIFTHDIQRYRRVLYDRMHDMTTLICGPSGTGKELVARAIGLSQYVPFDTKTHTFAQRFPETFHPLNISALSPTLIESELFGNRRGAFTGAVEDRVGWLEACPPRGTVFLDEVGDIDPTAQVKLLRVLQTRAFQRLGDTHTRHFQGKIIAATHRNLAREIEAGRFRRDFYYRLCSDIVVTPTLHDLLVDEPGELRNLLLFITRRIAGDSAEELADEAAEWVEQRLGRDYPWPGNFRELEQCVRNIVIRREYVPAQAPVPGPRAQIVDDVLGGRLTAEALLRRYCTLVYSQTGSYVETARRLGLDRRTVKGKVDLDLLGRLRGKTGSNPSTEPGDP